MKKKLMDLNNFDQQLIIAGMTNLVDKGMTPHEVFELLDEIKNQTFHALSEIKRGEA